MPEFDREVAAYYEMVEAFVPEDKGICELDAARRSAVVSRAPVASRFTSSRVTPSPIGCSTMSSPVEERAIMIAAGRIRGF